MITVSIVSHLHGDMVSRLVSQLAALPDVSRIIVTLNLPETTAFASPKVVVTRNDAPRGFAENHNAAFSGCETPFFCVLNPDIELRGDPFPVLVAALRSDATLGVVGPLIVNRSGEVEDSARRYPTLPSLVGRVFSRPGPEYAVDPGRRDMIHPDWIGGMFMVFPAASYRRMHGFDPGYFLYYEDVDVCARLWQGGFRVGYVPEAVAIHDARRSSHRSLRYFITHMKSAARFLLRSRHARRPAGR